MEQFVGREAFTSAVGVGKRVLVVEDNADVRELLSELLGAHGYVVTGAATGTEGIAAALNSPPDLIIVDLYLPGADPALAGAGAEHDRAGRGRRVRDRSARGRG